MLTSKDLDQIQKIVHDEADNIIKRELKPVKADIVKIRKDMKTIVNFF